MRRKRVRLTLRPEEVVVGDIISLEDGRAIKAVWHPRVHHKDPVVRIEARTDECVSSFCFPAAYVLTVLRDSKEVA